MQAMPPTLRIDEIAKQGLFSASELSIKILAKTEKKIVKNVAFAFARPPISCSIKVCHHNIWCGARLTTDAKSRKNNNS